MITPSINDPDSCWDSFHSGDRAGIPKPIENDKFKFIPVGSHETLLSYLKVVIIYSVTIFLIPLSLYP